MDEHTLIERDGWLYVKVIEIDYQQPMKTSRCYPTGERLSSLAQAQGLMEAARARIGTYLTPQAGVSWLFSDEHGIRYRLAEDGATKATWTEQEPIPEPMQRGKQLPLRWHRGAWQKLTSKGWQWV
jgi:hypothetical protein